MHTWITQSTLFHAKFLCLFNVQWVTGSIVIWKWQYQSNVVHTYLIFSPCRLCMQMCCQGDFNRQCDIWECMFVILTARCIHRFAVLYTVVESQLSKWISYSNVKNQIVAGGNLDIFLTTPLLSNLLYNYFLWGSVLNGYFTHPNTPWSQYVQITDFLLYIGVRKTWRV